MKTKKQVEFSNEEERTEALKLSIAGYSHDEIAKKLKRNITTISRWSIKYEWEKHKSQNQTKAQKNIFDKYREKIEEISSKALDGSRILVHVGVQELDHLRVANPNPGRSKTVRNSFDAWGKIVQLGTNIQRGAIPEASSELSELIYKELKKANDRTEKENKRT